MEQNVKNTGSQSASVENTGSQSTAPKLPNTTTEATPEPGVMYGYARVSTTHQNEDRQIIKLTEFGVEREHIFVDHLTGSNFERPGYRQMVERLQPGDIVVVTSLDRLGRNYTEIPEQWRILTKEKRCKMVVMDMPILDTRGAEDGVLREFMSDVILAVLAYTADIERKMNHARTMDGMSAARARGVKFGRKPMEIPELFESVFDEWARQEISANGAARKLGVARNTFLRWARSV